MVFEYNHEKSAANKRKHGVDFDEAQALWNDDDRLEVEARSADEPRYVVIASHKGKHWSAFVTYREENIRLISVRRASKKEVKAYEKAQSIGTG